LKANKGNMSTVLMDQVLADRIMRKAIAYCAEKKFSGDLLLAEQALRQGRCDICSDLSDSMVKQVGDYLGQVDRTVRAVYRYEPEFDTLRPQAGQPDAIIPKGGINLVAWVDRKSAALNALSDTLETMLTESRHKIGCMNATPACHTLDMQLVDNKDVQEQRGYSLVVNSLYMRSRRVWQREDLAEEVLPATLGGQVLGTKDYWATFDPELAPESTLLERALEIENLPEAERAFYEHNLREIKVALIRRMISDQLAYINLAKEWFTIADLAEIYKRKIGYGKIGGKAAGMLLAGKILNEMGDEVLRDCLRLPESFFLGSDVMYLFMAMNGLMHWNNQKYKPEAQIRAEYPQIQEEYRHGEFPPEVLDALQAVLEQVGHKPVIVRSSSQLEDNFGTAFAGKYESYFCPNQGTDKENLQKLATAIARTYASTLRPEALLYRRSKGLQDYDERMAILLQVVQGEQFGRYFLPQGAGVAFSHNIYRWAPQICREAGFARLVWGLGTRAVERVGNDYPRPVALSHPMLLPDDEPQAICHYSQQYVDLIDLEENALKSLPTREVLRPNYPPLRFLAQVYQEGYLATPRGRVMESEIPNLVITFDELLRRTPFATTLSRMLRLLEEHYHSAVDVEFTLHIPDTRALTPHVNISLLQCRPQSYLKPTQVVRVPKNISQEDIIFSTRFMVPQGYLDDIRYVVFIPPEEYFLLDTVGCRKDLGAAIGRVNAALPDRSFICVGPGRWGTTNTDLGVYVIYSDVCHSGALLELSGKGVGVAPEPSLGTHFFQDLMEAEIYPLAINLDEPETVFKREFFYETPNCLLYTVPGEQSVANCIRLIEVSKYRPGCHLEIAMDDEQGLAVGWLVRK